jgi:pimeloyl-ACP methyl ester carboxylesterase
MQRATASIVMVHGAFCASWVFENFRTPFEAVGHRVLTPDLPGHGPGETPAGISITAYADAVAELCRAQSVPPLLLGHSMGGLVAQMAADRVPVAGLMLLAPSAPWGVSGQSLEEAVSAVSLFALGPYWLQAVAPDRTVTGHYSIDQMDPAEQKRTYDRMMPESGRALFEMLSWWLDPMMTTAVRDAGRVRSLTIAGGKDAISPAGTVRRTAERLGGELRVFEGMSHWLPGEPGWEDVATACLDWISAS